MKNQSKVCVQHAQLTNKKKPQNTTECRSLGQKSGESEQQQSCKIPSPRISPCFLHLFSQLSSILPSPSNPLGSGSPFSRALFAKSTSCWLIFSVSKGFSSSGCCFPAWLFPSCRTLSTSKGFSHLCSLSFPKSGLKSCNVWCANH